jgi:hypothetical protein
MNAARVMERIARREQATAVRLLRSEAARPKEFCFAKFNEELRMKNEKFQFISYYLLLITYYPIRPE